MSAFIILIAISLLVAIGFLVSFLVSIKRGQFDDPVTPPIRMLFDDIKIKEAETASNPENK
jgi:cbb3-type cytochrome oxidase maturation protein